MRRVLDAEPTRILLLDDEESIRVAIARLLRSRGYEVVVVETPAAALAAVEMDRFAVMLCDVRMPGMSGLEVVPKALALDGDLAIVMLTAVNDAGTATDALGHGAMDYLVKPVELSDLQAAVERAARRRHLEMERRRVEEHIREEVAARTVELEQEQAALRELTVGVAEALINAMEAKDVYLRGHSRRVADQAASMAEELGLDEDAVENVRLAGRLHDVGKIGIREDVLNKPGTLTEEEFEHVKDHVRISMEILAPLKHIPVVLRYVHDHHEHFDGSGYPRGLRGEAISIGGRILAACDAFDALTSQRAFREAREPRETIDYLESSVGQLLDPRVFAALKKVVLRRRTLTFIEDVER
ncbi:MAG: two-component response regulator [Gemmatimonadetes bacterium]|jgi:putative two-component system response regulator|nr:two-component response regulator [Gemmatimonadota bacterium]